MATVRLTFQHNRVKNLEQSCLAFNGSDLDYLIRAWRKYGYKLTGYTYISL